MDDYIKPLGEARERLEAAKARRKEAMRQLADECEKDPRFADLIEQRKAISADIKIIKDEAMERTGLKAELDETAEEISLQNEIISGYVQHIIAGGQPVTIAQGIEIDGMTYKTKVTVQLKLL